MSLRQFENGYWYATELKEFAEAIGIASAGKLRKDELEHAIKQFLRSGAADPPARSLSVSGVKDVEIGLRLDLPVVRYTNDPETKEFLEREGRRIAPEMKRRSGARYRLNRWREQQIASGTRITYRDLIGEYVRLNQSEEPFAKIPHGRYINFLSEFLKKEPGATRERAIAAWKKLKILDIPKDYASWLKYRAAKTRR